MAFVLQREAAKLNSEKKRRGHGRKLLTVLSALVVFCTTYALILPAITLERSLICETEEHVHTDACYADTVVPETKELGCALAEHTHSDACYDEGGALVCGTEEHAHGEECFTVVPEHTEKTLVCGKEEHTHTDACYDALPEDFDPYGCGMSEHTHSEACYGGDGGLICTIPEHTHSGECASPALTVREDPSAHTICSSELPQDADAMPVVRTMMAPMLSAGSPSGNSSDLANFLTGDLVITKLDGTPIGDYVFVGESYKLQLAFKEVNGGRQFMYNTDGYLTYVLPTSLNCEDQSSQDIYFGSVKVGAYYVSGGIIYVRFDDVDNTGAPITRNFIDHYGNVEFDITFVGSVPDTGDDELIQIELSSNVTVEVGVKNEGKLEVHKEFLEYDEDTHQTSYRVTLRAYDGTVNYVELQDNLYKPQTFSHGVLKDGSGTVLELTPDVNEITSGGTELTQIVYHLGTLHSGDSFEYICYADVPEAVYHGGENLSAANEAYTLGYDLGNNYVDDYEYASKTIKFNPLKKSGTQVTKNINGEDVDLIEWKIQIGDGSGLVGNVILTDTMSGDQRICRDIPLELDAKKSDSNHVYAYPNWNDVALSDTSFSVSLPFSGVSADEAIRYNLTYYTYYDLGDGNSGSFGNSVSAEVNDIDYSVESTTQVVSSMPAVEKTAADSADGESIEYTVNVYIPSGFKDTGYFYVRDYAAFWNDYGVYDGVALEDAFGGLQEEYYIENSMADLEVTLTVNGSPVEIQRYSGSGSADGTYTVWRKSYQEAYLLFNVNVDPAVAAEPLSSGSTSARNHSVWKYNEPAVLTLRYRIPKSAVLGDWENITTSLAVNDLLEAGYSTYNYAALYYGSSDLKTEAEAEYEETSPMKKSGRIVPGGNIKYNVLFVPEAAEGFPVDEDEYCDADTLRFLDDFDDRLEYVPGTLKCVAYQISNPSHTYSFTYTGSGDGFDGEISALFSDFLSSDWDGSSHPHLQRFFDYHHRHSYRFEFTYELSVKDEYLAGYEDESGNISSIMTFDNTAVITWDGGTAPTVSTEVIYDTGLLKKESVQNGDKLLFTIEVNEKEIDLLDNAEYITLHDTMSPNLSLYFDSVKVFYYESGDWVQVTDCEVSYVSEQNRLVLKVKDNKRIKITYTTIITENGSVDVYNTVRIDGFGEAQSAVNSTFSVSKTGGSASAGNLNFTLFKTDNMTNPIPNVSFGLYTDLSSAAGGDSNPNGLDETIEVMDNEGNPLTLYYYRTYTTGSAGWVIIENQALIQNHIYALKEIGTPEGCEPADGPFVFLFNPDGMPVTTSLTNVVTTMTVVNDLATYELPATGGYGTGAFITGGALLAGASLLLLSLRKRRRREDG